MHLDKFPECQKHYLTSVAPQQASLLDNSPSLALKDVFHEPDEEHGLLGDDFHGPDEDDGLLGDNGGLTATVAKAKPKTAPRLNKK
jgi:hypothetical protein